ncbi:hypothetical protein KCP73_07145 [Salmonella enterica subsp. enterica]|nr:hypothetical protein KCP73_07145 [Salmonella enterica subsp. enterica]
MPISTPVANQSPDSQQVSGISGGILAHENGSYPELCRLPARRPAPGASGVSVENQTGAHRLPGLYGIPNVTPRHCQLRYLLDSSTLADNVGYSAQQP